MRVAPEACRRGAGSRGAAAALVAALIACGCHDLMTLGEFADPVVVPGPATIAPPVVTVVDAGPVGSVPASPLIDASIDVVPDASPVMFDLTDAARTSAPDARTPDARTSIDAGGPTPLPECLAPASSGPLNAPGSAVGATETLTDWTFSAPVESMQWELRIEQDVADRDPGTPAIGGYYWVHSFSFEQGGVSGRLGLQSEGVYQADPADPTFEIRKIAVFWLSGPPIAAELGDIPNPDARVAAITATGADWLTIHARFDWEVCHLYRMRFARESTDADGNIWYGAWIEDATDDVDILLGRMLLPTDVGLLSPFSSSRTIPIDFSPSACNTTLPVSAVFGAPMAEDGRRSELQTNRFSSTLRCPTSRFSNFETAVRQELAVRP